MRTPEQETVFDQLREDRLAYGEHQMRVMGEVAHLLRAKGLSWDQVFDELGSNRQEVETWLKAADLLPDDY